MTTLEWTLEFTAPALDVWSVLADTDAFNRAANLDFSFERVDGVMRGNTSIAGISSSWVETPISWQTPNHFESKRDYDSGPVRTATARCTLAEHPNGTTVHYQVDLEPRNVLMTVPVKMLASTVIRPGLYRALQAASAAIRGEDPCFDPPPPLDSNAQDELEQGLNPIDTEVAKALRQRILNAPLPVQHRMRPLQIAEEEQLEAESVVRECVLAATAGALRMELQILCPRCRGAHQRTTLIELEQKGIHCPTCDIRYDGHLGDNMEVVFGPGESVRPGLPPVDCVFSPMRTPHILVQVHLKPGGTGRWDAKLESGGYRLETPGAEIWIIADPECEETELHIDLNRVGFSPTGLRVKPGKVHFVVRSGLDRTAMVALHARWRPPHTLTVAELFTYPSVREILPEGLQAGLKSRVEPGVVMVMEAPPPSMTRALQLLDSPITRIYGKSRALLICPDAITALEEAERLAAAHLMISVGFARGAVVAMEQGSHTDWAGPAVDAAFRTMRSLGRPRIAIDTETLEDPEVQAALATLGPRVRVSPRNDLPPLLAFSAWFDRRKAKVSSGSGGPSSATTAPRGDEPLLVPDEIGRFKVLHELDRGGMGQVFEVLDEKGGRWALKRLISASDRPDLAQLFHKEAYYASMIQHPNVVDVVDWGDDHGRPYLVMEVLVGRSLQTELKKRRKLPQKDAVPVLLGLLDALSAVHAIGLVHRDIKPGNVFLLAPPTPIPHAVKLLDFGLMRHSGVVAGDGLAGTPDYMAPEQLMREEQDPRTDVYAVGALAYRMLSGRIAWRGDTLGERAIQRVGTNPDVLDWDHIPENLSESIKNALQPRPEDRFQSAKEMREAIASAQ